MQGGAVAGAKEAVLKRRPGLASSGRRGR
jgi:hypothetical protein